MDRTTIIKQRLSEELKLCGLSQTILAKKLNISQSCIAHYKRGDIIPSVETLAEICDLLNIDANYLLAIDETKSKTYCQQNNNFSDNNGTININQNNTF